MEIAPAKLAMFKVLPTEMASDNNPITPEKIALGRMLYYETRLSKSQKISCNTCHMLDKYGVDNESTSDGHKGQKGDRNSPTVYNAAGHFVQFWDGRAANVEEQAKGPVLNPVEMAMTAEKQVVAVIQSMPEYVAAFKAAFPADKHPVNYNNMARAIGAFERKLVTPSRWDKFLAGDQSALTDTEKAGFNLFVDSGCNACHMGAYVGGSMYQKFGALKPYPDQSDAGRAKVTKNDAHRMMFKVPTLRNIDKTGPYFHTGKMATLDGAVTEMADYQLGKQLKPEEVEAIVAWLATLTGEIPAEYIKPPALPKSTSKTPKPDPGDQRARQAAIKTFRELTGASLAQRVSPEGRTLGFLACHITTTLSEMMSGAGLAAHETAENQAVAAAVVGAGRGAGPLRRLPVTIGGSSRNL